MQSPFWRQLILQWELTEPFLHFYYALFAVTFHHISAYSCITLSSVLRSFNSIFILFWIQFYDFEPSIWFQRFSIISNFRSQWSIKSDFVHRSTYSLIDNNFIHVEKITIQSKINNSQMIKSFFATRYEMYNVHFSNDVVNYTFVFKMPKIDFVLQNSHIFMFMISSTIKKIEKSKMFLANFNVKKNYWQINRFVKKSLFLKTRIKFSLTTQQKWIQSYRCEKNQDVFMYNDKLIQNTIIAILKLSAFVTINSTNYQFLIQSKFKSTQFKSIQSKLKSKVIKFVDVKKIYIFENNDNDDNSDGDKAIFHDNDDDESISQQHFITFIKTLFVVNKSNITNQSIDTFVIQFTFDAHQFTSDAHSIVASNDAVSINLSHFIVTNNDAVSINLSHFVLITTLDDINDDAVVVSIINNDAVSTDLNHLDISSDIVSVNFDHFTISLTLSLFENVIEKLSIFFSKTVYIVFNNESNNDDACDSDDVTVKKKNFAD